MPSVALGLAERRGEPLALSDSLLLALSSGDPLMLGVREDDVLVKAERLTVWLGLGRRPVPEMEGDAGVEMEGAEEKLCVGLAREVPVEEAVVQPDRVGAAEALGRAPVGDCEPEALAVELTHAEPVGVMEDVGEGVPLGHTVEVVLGSELLLLLGVVANVAVGAPAEGVTDADGEGVEVKAKELVLVSVLVPLPAAGLEVALGVSVPAGEAEVEAHTVEERLFKAVAVPLAVLQPVAVTLVEALALTLEHPLPVELTEAVGLALPRPGLAVELAVPVPGKSVEDTVEVGLALTQRDKDGEVESVGDTLALGLRVRTAEGVRLPPARVAEAHPLGVSVEDLVPD